MRAHAVVIGIDHYTEHPEWDLQGATRDAVNFARWVTQYGGVAAGDLTLLLSPPVGQKRPAGLKSGAADRRTINDTLDDYQERRKAKGADRFWFYYAGHGMAAPGGGPSEGPLIVPADTHSLKHDTVAVELFRESMQDVEPKEQFFFIDACRDVLDVKEKKTLTQRIYWDPRDINDNKLATQVVFLATTVGKKAKELRGQGIFSRVLLAALKGLGPVLGEPPDSKAGRLSLYFNSLNAFVRDAVTRELADVEGLDDDARTGSVPYATIGKSVGDVEVTQFDVKTLPKAKISTVIEPAGALKEGRLEFLEWSASVAADVPVTDPAPIEPLKKAKHTFELRGGKHKVRVKAPGYETLTRPLLVYEDKSFLLKLTEAARPAAVPRGGGRGSVKEAVEEAVKVPFGAKRAKRGKVYATALDRLTRLTVFDGGGDARGHGIGTLDVKLPPGPYIVRGEMAGMPADEQTIEVMPGTTSDVKVDIAKGNYIDPSENFGDVANARFCSMLAFAAWAARWPERAGFHRLRAVGVDPLPGLGRKSTALQVLIGDALEEKDFLAACKVSLQKVEDGPLTALHMKRLPKMKNAAQGALIEALRSIRVRVEMPGFVPATFVVSLLPKLVSVLVVTREKSGSVEVLQHFNPIDPTKPVARELEKPKLDDVRVVDIGARALENREPLAENDYERLVGTKGTNPMLGLIAGYRTLNTPHARNFSRTPLTNMLEAFPTLPDVHVLAGLHRPKERDAHFQRAMEAGTPVFAEGFWALFDWITAQSAKRNLAPPVLRQQLTSGMVWTSFLDSQPEAKDAVRIVTTSGRTSLATINDNRGVMVAARSVGRISSESGPMLSTAFLLRPRIAVVPVHVAEAFAKRDDRGEWTMTMQASIQFDLADPTSKRRVTKIVRTVRPGEANVDGGSLDAAMLDICWPVLLELDDDAPVPPLAIAANDAAQGDRVSVIGFPVDTPSAATFGFAHHFTGASGEKHVMPGVVERAAGTSWSFDHNCFTAPGTSGGPIVNHAGAVVGMHVVGRASQEGFKTGTGIAMVRLKF